MTQKLPAGFEIPPEPSEAAPALTVVSYREWGTQLPIGFLSQGMLHRGVGFRRWTGRTDRELEEMRALHKGTLTQPEWMSMVLAKMLTHFGPHDFNTLDDGMRRLVLSQAWVGDVMFAILALRISALGSAVRFDFECGACAHKWRAGIDLLDIDLKVPTDPSALAWMAPLRDGIQIGKHEYTRFIMDPPRWGSLLLRVGRKTVQSDALAAMVSGSVRSALSDDPEAPPISLLASQVEDLSKWDYSQLQREIDAHALGPQFQLTSECPNCGHENKHGVDWSWDFLFKSASL